MFIDSFIENFKSEEENKPKPPVLPQRKHTMKQTGMAPNILKSPPMPKIPAPILSQSIATPIKEPARGAVGPPAPPPPPPPPPPIQRQSIPAIPVPPQRSGNAPIAPQPQQQQDDPRSALMDSIKKGATLKVIYKILFNIQFLIII